MPPISLVDGRFPTNLVAFRFGCGAHCEADTEALGGSDDVGFALFGAKE